MQIEDIIRRYQKKIEHKKETVKDYKESHDPELLNSVPLYEKEIAEAQLIVSALELSKAKEDGRLVGLPCKVGDVLYWIDRNEVYESKADEIAISNGHFIIDSMNWRYADFGKTVFLTREAAEKALGGAES